MSEIADELAKKQGEILEATRAAIVAAAKEVEELPRKSGDALKKKVLELNERLMRLLLTLDGVTGGPEWVTPLRKDLVKKVQAQLSRVDEVAATQASTGGGLLPLPQAQAQAQTQAAADRARNKGKPDALNAHVMPEVSKLPASNLEQQKEEEDGKADASMEVRSDELVPPCCFKPWSHTRQAQKK